MHGPIVVENTHVKKLKEDIVTHINGKGKNKLTDAQIRLILFSVVNFLGIEIPD